MIRKRRRSNSTIGYQVTYPGSKSRTFDTRKDAALYESEVKRRARLGEFAPAEPETFGEALARHLAAKSLECKPKTMLNLREAERNLSPLASVKFPMLRKLDVETVIRSIAARPAPRQAQIAGALAKAVCKEAVENGQRVDPGIAGIKLPRYAGKTHMYLTREQVYELASYLPAHVRRVVIVAALTGLRQGELFNLTTQDVDLERGYVTVRSGKTKSAARSVALSTEARKELREQLMERPPSEYVFPTKTGDRYLANTFMYQSFRPARIAAGLEGLTFHDLRHTFASFLIAASAKRGMGHAVTQKVGADALGHADGGVLFMRLYSHLMPDSQQIVASALDALFDTEDPAPAVEA